MARLFIVGLVAAMLSVFTMTDAMAQIRDGGAKARGGNQLGFWNYNRSQSSRSGGNYYRPTRPRADYYLPAQESEGYQSFSYEPLIKSGDTVAVTGGPVRLMLGRDVVGTVPDGLNFRVLRVVDGWLGAAVNVDGTELKGWIWNGNVARAAPAVGSGPASN